VRHVLLAGLDNHRFASFEKDGGNLPVLSRPHLDTTGQDEEELAAVVPMPSLRLVNPADLHLGVTEAADGWAGPSQRSIYEPGVEKMHDEVP
jgi:hypothetical protein